MSAPIERSNAPRRRGPGRPSARSIARELDAALLRDLRGAPVLDPSTGHPIVDADGEPVLLPAPPALLAVARARIKDLERAGKAGGARPRDYTAELVAEARRRGMKPRPRVASETDDDDLGGD